MELIQKESVFCEKRIEDKTYYNNFQMYLVLPVVTTFLSTLPYFSRNKSETFTPNPTCELELTGFFIREMVGV